MVEVFATSRAIRSFYTSFKEPTTLLPKAMSIQELEQKAILIEERVLIDEEMRLLLMQEATKFSKFDLLHIDSEFFVFLKNSDYLFRFFEELSYEKVKIENLKDVDTYAQYEEHLEILSTLLTHYKALLAKHGFYDTITKVEHYTLNKEFILSLKEVKVHLEGFLNRFEIDLLTQIASLIPLHVSFNTSAYNQKITSLFAQDGVEFKNNHHYEIDFATKKICKAEPNEAVFERCDVFGFSSRLAQVGYIHNCIAQWINEGMRPEEIVVILPDERFSEVIRGLDSVGNLNFAMGIPMRHSFFYKHLSSIEKAIRSNRTEDRLRLERYALDESLIFTCKENWSKKISVQEILNILALVANARPKEMATPLFKEIFFAFEHFLHKAPPLRLEQVVKLFLNRLMVQSQDDVRGGKVTVLGLLETRGVSYKGVIVIDFNDDVVPKRSQKDLFLSSGIRAHAGLPTQKDRENLQRYYYHQLFSKAQRVAISYVKNTLSSPSRFLDELGLKSTQMADEKELYSHLFTPHKRAPFYDKEFIDSPYELLRYPLSATKLKVLLSCKRQFYFRYIAKLREAKMPSDTIDELSVGRILHKVLETCLSDETLQDEKTLSASLNKALKSSQDNVVWEYFSDLWLEQLKPFIQEEVKRFHEGYKIERKEESFQINYKGYMLEGQIDRIDSYAGKLFVIDYKSGKVLQSTEKTLEGTTDFQLVFYALIAQSLGVLGGVYYYDLKKGSLVEEAFLEEKTALLDEHLQTLSKPLNGYEKCEGLSACRFCTYVRLCAREDLI